MEALLTREKVFGFLNRAASAINGSSFKIMDAKDNVFLSGENISFNENIEDESIEFLTKLRKIELNYDLLFLRPQDNAEYKKVDILSELIELGYTKGFKAIQGLETYSTDKKQLFKFGLCSMLNKSLYILHKGKFRCKLYGNDFSLGEMSVLMGPYITKGSGAICKALTYATDDKRKINLRLCEHSVCYLIADESKVSIDELINNGGKCIRVEDMECRWDYIYEVNEKCKNTDKKPE